MSYAYDGNPIYCARCGNILEPHDVVLEVGDNYVGGALFCDEVCFSKFMDAEFTEVQDTDKFKSHLIE